MAKKNLTKAQMRVEVAKDVIKQIKAARFVVTPGTYVNGKLDLPDSYRDEYVTSLEEAQKAVEYYKLLEGQLNKYTKQLKTCEVCAKGALFISTVDKYNRTTVADIADLVMDDTLDNCALDDPSDCIEWLFDADQLKDIEDAFEEGNSFNNGVNYDLPDEPEERLIAIMQNIIAHRGRFVNRSKHA